MEGTITNSIMTITTYPAVDSSYSSPPSHHPPSEISFLVSNNHGITSAPAPVLLEDGEITVLTGPTTMPTTTECLPASTATSASSSGAPLLDLFESTPPAPSQTPPAIIRTSDPAAAAGTSLLAAQTPTPQEQEHELAIVPFNHKAIGGEGTVSTAGETEDNNNTPDTTNNDKSNDTMPTDLGAVRNDTDYYLGAHKTYPKEVGDIKKRRKGATIAVGITAGIVGLAALGPVGGIVFGAAGAGATRVVGKRHEKKVRQRLVDEEIAQQHVNAKELNVRSGIMT